MHLLDGPQRGLDRLGVEAVHDLPALIAQFNQPAAGQTAPDWVLWISANLANGNQPLYIVLFFLLIVGFTYFYTAFTFKPDETAEQLRKNGGFIPGIRPGKPTADYLRYVLSRITLPGSIYLGVIAVLPNLFLEMGNSGGVQNLPFGGTAVLIMIGVGLDTVKQIESQLMQRNYEGFLR